MNQPEHINVIEIRKAANGYVVSAWMSSPWTQAQAARGYATYVVESDDPEAVGRAVALAIQRHAITLDVPIAPARELP